MIHSGAARRWNNEQRKKWLRRQIYHAQDIAGGLLWGMVFIIGFAMLVFCVAHR